MTQWTTRHLKLFSSSSFFLFSITNLQQRAPICFCFPFTSSQLAAKRGIGNVCTTRWWLTRERIPFMKLEDAFRSPRSHCGAKSWSSLPADTRYPRRHIKGCSLHFARTLDLKASKAAHLLSSIMYSFELSTEATFFLWLIYIYILFFSPTHTLTRLICWRLRFSTHTHRHALKQTHTHTHTHTHTWRGMHIIREEPSVFIVKCSPLFFRPATAPFVCPSLIPSSSSPLHLCSEPPPLFSSKREPREATPLRHARCRCGQHSSLELPSKCLHSLKPPSLQISCYSSRCTHTVPFEAPLPYGHPSHHRHPLWAAIFSAQPSAVDPPLLLLFSFLHMLGSDTKLK